MTEQLAASLEPWVVGAVTLVYAVLTVAALVGARRTGRAGWWVSAMFGSLAAFLIASWVSLALNAEPTLWAARLALAVLLLVPYLLLRFAASFRHVARWARIAVSVTAAAVVGAASLLEPADAGNALWIRVYLVVVLVYWVGLSVVASAWLWRAGRGQPTVARRRMRLMSVAAIVLAAGLLMSGLSDVASDLAQLVVMSVVLLSGLFFAIGFKPPRALVLSWRKPEDQQLQRAMMNVLRAGPAEDVAAELVPAVVRLVGGSGAVLTDGTHKVLAAHGVTHDRSTTVAAQGFRNQEMPTSEVVPLGDGRGELVVWTSAYSPFFAREEMNLLHTMASFAGLALERSELLAQERARRALLHEARAEAEHARDEADRANNAKSQFLSRMSHELRTPLNAILGFGQLLDTADFSRDDQEAVKHIVKAGHHLLALINDVLDLSRIEAGLLAISLEPVHASDLIDDAVSLIQPLADARSIHVAHGGDGCDDYVMTDRQRCRQVLLNLLSNAVKYNHDGGRVRIDCNRVDADTLQFRVSDTGPGIDVARQARLFEPFDRLGAENTAVEGTGLGLSLSKQLVERLGGAIGLDASHGRGSAFWVNLPIAEKPADVDALPVEARPAQRPAENRTLLLVEDNLANLQLVEAILRRRSHVSVLPVMQGALAAELALQHQPDVVVLDLHLPDIPGREVLGRLRADRRTRAIPVIIASADATPGRIRQLEEEGAFAYVAKPLNVDRFLEVIDAALSGTAPVGAGPAGS